MWGNFMVEVDNSFIEEVKVNYPQNYEKIVDAYYFANNSHDGILRKSGEPYIIHPLSVARILMQNNMDYSTIMAGLLHDVVEDTDVSLDDIRDKFGNTVAKLVDGVTKIDEITLEKENLTESDSMKRLLLAMGDDVRVIFIKLADRLHNLRTVKFLSRDRQIKMANETNEIFIPIAERIGIRKIRSELQELAFECLYPDAYAKIKASVDKNFNREKQQVGEIEKQLREILTENHMNGIISDWPERYYSIYKKMKTKGLDKVYGSILFKIIVDDEKDCYLMLGLLHKKFRHIPGQIKDFISSPKPNGYKSLHTVLMTKDSSVIFKVMIRTASMDQVCEYGISSLWNDKDAEVDFFEKFEKYNVFKNIVLNEKDEINNSDFFIDAIKTDLSSNTTWAFTPKYKPICLNSDKPTAIDFAYAVHTYIGHNALSAIINGKKSSIGATLSSGDVVEIVVSDTDKSPSRNWLQVVKTPYARRQIRDYFIDHTTTQNVKLGKKELISELERMNHTLNDFMVYYPKIEKEFDFMNIDDMFASIAYKSVTLNQILRYMIIDDNKHKLQKISPVEIENSKGILNVSFPKCCSAIPGDEIVGVISKNGVAIHTKNCTNLAKMGKIIVLNAKWKQNTKRDFNVNLKIVAKDKLGFASKLFDLFTIENINISKIEAKKQGSDECEFKVTVSVKNNEELEKIICKIKEIDEVRIITRNFE